MRTVDPGIWYKKSKTNGNKTVRGSSDIEVHLRDSFNDALNEFWTNCSSIGVRLVRKTDKEIYKYIYLSLFLVSLACGSAILIVNLYEFSKHIPLTVTLLSTQHRPQHADFPAVALCSYNIISQKALKAYARHLFDLDRNRTFSLLDIERNLLAYGGLITWNLAPFNLRFIGFLAKVDHETNVTNILLKLTPNCEAMLVKCSWKSRVRHCNRLFALRITYSGFCCIFNSRYRDPLIKNLLSLCVDYAHIAYVKQIVYRLDDSQNEAAKLGTVGVDEGLSVIVKENFDDFAYIRRPGHNIEVMLFNGNQYPMTKGPGIRTYPAQHNSSVLFKLSVSVQYPSHALEYYSNERRGCHLTPQGEPPNEVECLVKCRRRAILALCFCVPHTWQPEPNDKICTPEHLPCLYKHREKFTFYYPGRKWEKSLSKEISVSTNCEICIFDCARISYTTKITHVNYQYLPLYKMFHDKFMKGVELHNVTVIRIFYGSDDQLLYMVEPSQRWFEKLAIMGSQWLCLGAVMVVSVLELQYYLTIRWFHHYRRRSKTATKKNRLHKNI